MNAAFLKLLNMSAAGSVLILAVVLLRLLLKKAPRWLICVMWGLVAVRLVCPFSFSSPLSAFRATPSIVSEQGEVEVFRPAGGSEKPLIRVDTVQVETPQAGAATIRELPGTGLAVTQRSRDAYLPPLVQTYLIGVGVMLLYAAVSTWLLRRKVAASLKLEGNLRLCDTIPSPFILGLFRPRIYLPSSLDGEERRFVLAHERAHLRRRDHWWKPLGFLILSVHWFNPLCWLAYVLLCRDIELACDEKVIRELGREARAGYSQTLLNCSAHRILAACPVAFGETGVKTRVKAVLNYKKPAFWIILAAVLGCVVLIVCFASKPMPAEPDLSFLNYKNAIPLIGMNDTAPYARLYPADSDGVQPGVADSKALVQYLESAAWTECSAPASSPDPRGFIEFMIEDDYRIIVYQSERLAAVHFGNEVRYYRIGADDYAAALAAFIPAPSTAPDRLPEQAAWTLQCRVQSSGLAEFSVPAALSAALEAKLARQIPLEGMEASFVEGWGMRYPAGADLLPVYLLAPGESFVPSACVQRNANGQYGFNGFEAHEELCAILDWLAEQTGWPVHADPSEFRDLTAIELLNGGEPLLRIEEPARLAAFEALMQSEMYTVGDASKTPTERVELCAIRSDGMVLTLLLDPEGPFLWLPPFGYYRYNAPESTGVRPMLDALGLDDWPEELKTPDYNAMRETYERLQPLPAVTEPEAPPAEPQTAQRRMTMEEVYTLAEAAKAAAETGQPLTLQYFEDFEGLSLENEVVGVAPAVIRFPISDSFCLDVYAEDRGGRITQALLLIADENGAFRPRPGYYIDIFKQDLSDFLMGVRSQTLTVASGGVTINPTLFYYHGMLWTDDGWLFADGLPLEILLADQTNIAELTLAEDFRTQWDGARSGLQIYNENLDLVRGEEFYLDTGVNWLEPGRYYAVMEVTIRGRYIESEGTPEIGTYRAVFRLIVPEGGAEPYAPNKAVGLTRASLCRNGIPDEEPCVLTDRDALATLEEWLQDAEPFYGDILEIPFRSVLTLTRSDGRTLSCCPAEDDSGLLFSNGFYYLLPVGGAEFRALFGLQPR